MDMSPQVNPISSSKSPFKVVLFIVLSVVIVGVGIGAGYLLSKKGQTANTPNGSQTTPTNSTINNGTQFGSTDLTTFKDSASGTLQKGGLNGEGTHQLVRDGGPSQTVYLVSSIVDLDQFVGKKVEIHGQTLKAKRVGWLMDVGQVKILE